MVSKKSKIKTILLKIYFFSLLKLGQFPKAIRIVKKHAPSISSGVKLDDIQSIYLEVKDWIPFNAFLPNYIKFLEKLFFLKEKNLFFNLCCGITHKFPNNFKANLLFCQFCIEMNLFHLLTEYPDRLLNSAPTDPRVLNVCGTIYFKIGKLSKAKSLLSKAIELFPNDIRGYQNLANILIITDELSESERLLNSALNLNPKSINLWTLLAQLKLMQKDERGFTAAINKMRTIDPTHQNISLLRYLESAEKKNPNNLLLNEWIQKCFDEGTPPNILFRTKH